MSDRVSIISLFIASAMLAVCSLGYKHQIAVLQAQAIKHGAAHWEVDADTGRTTFTWNEK